MLAGPSGIPQREEPLTPRTLPPPARDPPTSRTEEPLQLFKKNEINCYFPHTVSEHCFLSLLVPLPLPLCPTKAGSHVLSGTAQGRVGSTFSHRKSAAGEHLQGSKCQRQSRQQGELVSTQNDLQMLPLDLCAWPLIPQ